MDCPVCGVELAANERICAVCGPDHEAWQQARAVAHRVPSAPDRSAGSHLVPAPAPPLPQAFPTYPAQALPVGPPITAVNRRVLQPLGIGLIVAGVVLGAFLVLAVLNKPPTYDDVQTHYPEDFLMLCGLGPLLLFGGAGVLALRLSRRR
jgi:hypothetical protein